MSASTFDRQIDGIQPVTPAQRRAATIAAGTYARDADELATFLQMAGLIDSPEPTEDRDEYGQIKSKR